MIDFSALASEHPRLAQTFAQFWETPLAEYGRTLIDLAARQLPQEFLDLWAELAHTGGWSAPLVEDSANQLCELPWLQCAHHTTPTHGPTFSTIDLISLSALGPKRVYPIVAASGVAYSNSAWSGALSYGHLELAQVLRPEGPGFKRAQEAAKERAAHGEAEQRVSLIPAKMRDQLVYQSGLPVDFSERLDALQPELGRLLAPVRGEDTWAQWAARTAAGLGERVFGGRWLVMDLNRLAALWIARRLKAGDGLWQEIFKSDWPGAELNFLAPYRGKKSNKVLPCTYARGVLSDTKGTSEPLGLAQLAQALETGRLAPGVWLCFLALRFELGLHCLGSFSQADYLPRFAQALAQAPYGGALDLAERSAPILTTGRVKVEGELIWVVDRALEGRSLNPSDFAVLPMKHFWAPIARQLGASEG